MSEGRGPYVTSLGSDGDGVTGAERARFLAARNGKLVAANKMLTAHLEWRHETLPLSADAPRLGEQLPRLARFLPQEVDNGSNKRVLLIFGAMYDAARGTPQQYTDAMAALLDEELDRNSDEKIVIVIDTRGGYGMANPDVWTLIPWFRALSATLTPNFPERLSRLVVCPMPAFARAVWLVVSAFLDRNVAAKVQLLSGSTGPRDPLPAGVGAYLSEDALAYVDRLRAAPELEANEKRKEKRHEKRKAKRVAKEAKEMAEKEAKKEADEALGLVDIS
jgi:hypothetical protein